MSVEDEKKKKINQSNKSWICNKLFIPEDKKNERSWSCNMKI